MEKTDASFLFDISLPLTFGASREGHNLYWRYKNINTYLPHNFFRKNKPPFYCRSKSKMEQFALEIFQQIVPVLKKIRKTHKSAITEVFLDHNERLVLFLKYRTHHIFVQPVCF